MQERDCRVVMSKILRPSQHTYKRKTKLTIRPQYQRIQYYFYELNIWPLYTKVHNHKTRKSMRNTKAALY
jgi:hypothetical protein